MEKKKNIGIFTYMLSNYGAVLQCYALQRYLRNNTHDNVEVIDFTTKAHLQSLKILGKKSANPLKNLFLNFLTLFHNLSLKRRIRRTLDFKKRYINYTSRYSDMKTLLDNPPKEDVYVTGSDQVFNLNSSYVDVYYLNFDKGKSRKVAYAPSFGVTDFDEDYKQRVQAYIKDFDALSCREQTGAKFLSELTGREVPVVADPTLLLTAEEWKSVAVPPKYENYILIYDLNGRDSLVSIAKKLQKELSCKIVCITNNVRNHYHVDKIVYDAGPAEFVGWFMKAKYVVTDSFHGTSFSLIFNKPFNTYLATPKTSDRVRTILGRFSLQWRIVENGNAESFSYSVDLLKLPNAEIDNLVLLSYQYIDNNILCL